MAKLDSLNVSCESCGGVYTLSSHYLPAVFADRGSDRALIVTCEHCREDDVLAFPGMPAPQFDAV